MRGAGRKLRAHARQPHAHGAGHGSLRLLLVEEDVAAGARVEHAQRCLVAQPVVDALPHTKRRVDVSRAALSPEIVEQRRRPLQSLLVLGLPVLEARTQGRVGAVAGRRIRQATGDALRSGRQRPGGIAEQHRDQDPVAALRLPGDPRGAGTCRDFRMWRDVQAIVGAGRRQYEARHGQDSRRASLKAAVSPR
jgi:hypothetical protein